MRTLTVTWSHGKQFDPCKATLTYTPSTYRNSDVGYTDSEALGVMLSEISPTDTYTVKFRPATKKATAAARVPLTFTFDDIGPWAI